MTEFITYRLTGTGVWGYEFFDVERNQIGFVRNALSRAEPVRIEGLGCSWYSRFRLDATIFPGTGRRVKDSRTVQDLTTASRGITVKETEKMRILTVCRVYALQTLFLFWGIWYDVPDWNL